MFYHYEIIKCDSSMYPNMKQLYEIHLVLFNTWHFYCTFINGMFRYTYDVVTSCAARKAFSVTTMLADNRLPCVFKFN